MVPKLLIYKFIGAKITHLTVFFHCCFFIFTVQGQENFTSNASTFESQNQQIYNHQSIIVSQREKMINQLLLRKNSQASTTATVQTITASQKGERIQADPSSTSSDQKYTQSTASSPYGFTALPLRNPATPRSVTELRRKQSQYLQHLHF